MTNNTYVLGGWDSTSGAGGRYRPGKAMCSPGVGVSNWPVGLKFIV